MVSELVAETRNAAKALAKFLGDDERGGEVLIEDFHVLVSAMGLLNSSADRIEALEADDVVREECAKRAGNYLMLKTPLDVERIIECEQAIRGLTP
jgi:hypothetical protein